MSVTLHASGTQSATVATEHFLSSPNVAGAFALQVDLTNMVAGDVVELRAYKMVLTGGTARVVWVEQFSGVQPADAVIVITDAILNTLTDANAVRFSLKQTFGTSRDFPWAVYNWDDGTSDAVKISGDATAADLLEAMLDASETGTAQAGAASTITLRSGASAVDDFFKDQVIRVASGAGAGQTNRITGYVGSSKVATVGTAWVTQPDNTSVYVILGRVG